MFDTIFKLINDTIFKRLKEDVDWNVFRSIGHVLLSLNLISGIRDKITVSLVQSDQTSEGRKNTRGPNALSLS